MCSGNDLGFLIITTTQMTCFYAAKVKMGHAIIFNSLKLIVPEELETITTCLPIANCADIKCLQNLQFYSINRQNPFYFNSISEQSSGVKIINYYILHWIRLYRNVY